MDITTVGSIFPALWLLRDWGPQRCSQGWCFFSPQSTTFPGIEPSHTNRGIFRVSTHALLGGQHGHPENGSAVVDGHSNMDGGRNPAVAPSWYIVVNPIIFTTCFYTSQVGKLAGFLNHQQYHINGFVAFVCLPPKKSIAYSPEDSWDRYTSSRGSVMGYGHSLLTMCLTVYGPDMLQNSKCCWKQTFIGVLGKNHPRTCKWSITIVSKSTK